MFDSSTNLAFIFFVHMTRRVSMALSDALFAPSCSCNEEKKGIDLGESTFGSALTVREPDDDKLE